jgi:hypothetical protein
MIAYILQKRDARQDDEVPAQAAVTIQTKYRQYQAKSTVDEKRREIAAIKVQSAARGFLARQRVKRMRFDSPFSYFLTYGKFLYWLLNLTVLHALKTDYCLK